MIGVLDYKYCNSKSVFETVNVLTDNVCYVTEANQFKSINKLIIPGVGSAKNTMDYIKGNGIEEEIKNFAEKGNLILGICLGMQIFFKSLSENGYSEGLGFFKSKIEPLKEISKIKTNIGWRKIEVKNNNILNIRNDSFYYFCHSYYAKIEGNEDKFISSSLKVLNKIPAIINKDNIIGVQFHPEKSQKNGINLLENFVNL